MLQVARKLCAAIAAAISPCQKVRQQAASTRIAPVLSVARQAFLGTGAEAM
jgi:hypothetical protein